MRSRITTTTTTPTAAAAAALLALTACGSSSDDPPLDQSAAVMCEEFVSKRLKSPGSASFSGVTDTTINTISDSKPWKYKVSGHVDSDNAFGASKRNTYLCTISTKDGETWTLDDLQLTER